MKMARSVWISVSASASDSAGAVTANFRENAPQSDLVGKQKYFQPVQYAMPPTSGIEFAAAITVAVNFHGRFVVVLF
jgi:hypothetical protein